MVKTAFGIKWFKKKKFDQFANVLSLSKLQMLFLENYHPCHNEDIQKKEKKKLREFLILKGHLQVQRYVEVRGFK